MLTKDVQTKRDTPQIVSIEELVPTNHILRKVDRYIDFSFIYDLVEPLYSADIGRPSLDPVILFKLVLMQYLLGLGSMRRTVKATQTDVACRWFLGLDFFDPVPHFGTFSKNYKRRFEGTSLFEQIFDQILRQCFEQDLVETSTVFVDATHVKAHANRNKREKQLVKREVLAVEIQLQEEINQERAKYGKKPFDYDSEGDENKEPSEDSATEVKEMTLSPNDPDCGMFFKGQHQRNFAYNIQTAVDAHGWILGYHVARGNENDSRSFYGLYEKIKRFDIDEMVMDAGYKTPLLMHFLVQEGIVPILPYSRPKTRKENREMYRPQDFVYDEAFHCVLCPMDEVLPYTTTNRHGYREYTSDPEICIQCPELTRCTRSKNHQKKSLVHIYYDTIEYCKDIEHNLTFRERYRQRKYTVERSFAQAKECHGFRFTQMVGHQAMEMKTAMTYSAMNIKKLVNILDKREKSGRYSLLKKWILTFYSSFFISNPIYA